MLRFSHMLILHITKESNKRRIKILQIKPQNMKKIIFSFLVGCAMLLSQPTDVSAVASLPAGFGIETIATGLNFPTAAAFTPDGRILVAQKGGEVRIVDASGNLLPTPFITLIDVNAAEDRGLIGIAVDPNFATNGFVYLAYTYEVDPSQPGGYAFDPSLPNCTSTEDDWSDTDCYAVPKKTARVVRVTASGDTAPLSSMQVILGSVGGTAAQPSCLDYPGANDCIASDSGSHSIGGIRFGADGKLYVATGDGAGFFGPDEHAFRSQDLDHLSGKILRVNTDGTAPSDNPFYTGNPNDNQSKVYAYGLRNPYRFNFQPGTNTLYGGNVGWFQYEQINKVEPGDNFGWPCYEGGLYATNGYQNMTGCPLTSQQQADFKLPHYAYAHNTDALGAVTGGAFATSTTYPASIKDKYVFGDYIFGTLSTFDPSLAGPLTPGDVTILATGDEDEPLLPVEFITGPDGLVYYINVYPGELKRLIYSEQNPIAVISDEIVFGSALTMNFDGSNSSIIGDAPLSYSWDFGDGSSATGVNVNHTFAAAGTYTITLTVTSTAGYFSSTTKEVVLIAPQYDTDPQIINPQIIIPEGSQNVGNTLTVPTQITNVTGTGNDPFRLIYFIKDLNGNVVSQSEHPQLITLNQGQTTTIYHDLFLTSIGEYTVSIALRATDYARDFDTLNVAFPLNVVSRAPITTDDPIYRFWSSAYRSHFYTASLAERNSIQQNDPNWVYEGIAYNASIGMQSDLTAVYRFWSPIYRSHFFTISEIEKNTIQQNNPDWTYEGIGWHVYPNSEAGTKSVYRFWSNVYRSHFYTADESEKLSIEQNDPNWTYEGVGWYIK